MPTPSRSSSTPPSRQINSRKTAAERHRELLDAAVEVGAADGLGAVTLARVAEAVGVSQGLVHHYFSSAEEMVNATFRHAADTDLDAARARVATATTPVSQVTELLDYLFDDASLDAAALWVDAASIGRRNPSLAAEADTVNTAWLAFLADIVTHGARSGDFHVTDPHITARRLLTIIDGLGAQAAATQASAATQAPAATDSSDDPVYVRAQTATHGLPTHQIKGIARDFATHELGLN